MGKAYLKYYRGLVGGTEALFILHNVDLRGFMYMYTFVVYIMCRGFDLSISITYINI